MILAGIDIGTNSLRLLVAEVDRGSFREVCSERRITRLGQGMVHSGMIDPEAGERSLQALFEYRDLIRRYGAGSVAAVGTSALRIASNSRAFLLSVREETGIDVRVASGEEEARLTRLGVLYALRNAGVPSRRDSCIIDIGGGSTEVVITPADANPVIASLPLGAVYLTERFMTHDPPLKAELGLMRADIRNVLGGHLGEPRIAPSGLFIGTAGTMTTLASIKLGLAEYDPAKINGSELTRGDIDRMASRLGGLTQEERKAVRGLEPGREDIILAGAVVAQEIMAWFCSASLLVSDWGLLEGIVLDLYEKVSGVDAVGSSGR